MLIYSFFSVSLVMALVINSAILQALAHSSQCPSLVLSAFIVPAVRGHLCGVRGRWRIDVPSRSAPGGLGALPAQLRWRSGIRGRRRGRTRRNRATRARNTHAPRSFLYQGFLRRGSLLFAAPSVICSSLCFPLQED